MRTAGTFLIFAAVVLRGFVIFSAKPQFPLLAALLACYGLLLFVKTWLTHRKNERKPFLTSKAGMSTYLLLQTGLVLALLANSWSEDLFTLLFIPLSLDAVAFFGRRNGYLWIGSFSLLFTGALLFAEEGVVFGLAMGAFYSGMCFLFGGYSFQVRKAEVAQAQNQRMFDELQGAHRQLQGYADQLANLAVEQERNRLARDLHDSVTQTVFSMNLSAQSARLLLGKDPSRVAEQLLRIDTLAVSALSEIQSLVAQLRPRSVLEEGLPAALRRLAKDLMARDGLQIALEICGERTLNQSAALNLYSIAQEALVNVCKHSGVQEAALRLDLSEGRSCLEVEDQGHGFDPEQVPDQQGHLGLAGMAERAREIGWTLTVQSKRGQGTRVQVVEDRPENSLYQVSRASA